MEQENGELIDKIAQNQKIRSLSNKLIQSLKNHLKEESMLIRSELIDEISKIVLKEEPTIHCKYINGLCIDYNWKTLIKADPNIFIWMSVVICMMAFCFGWVLCKYKHRKLNN